MLGKILLLGLALWLVLTLLRQYRHSVDRSQPEQAKNEDMVRCATCGLHLPKGESIEADGRFFCCEDHRHQLRP